MDTYSFTQKNEKLYSKNEALKPIDELPIN